MNTIQLENKDSILCYETWPAPDLVIIDGPYGVSGFKGDPDTPKELPSIYEKHLQLISKYAKSNTTIWFWNTEIGWALVHPIFEKYGWDYKCCCIWDKGKSHVAGNVNTKKISKFPVVTEVCVQYTKRSSFSFDGKEVSMKEWLFREWKRTKLPFRLANAACGVKDAATRKYFTLSNLWYMPPADCFEKIVNFANEHGDEKGKPYFSLDGKKPLSAVEWNQFKPIFNCPFGENNVWHVPQLRNSERIKNGSKSLHLNQKPLSIIEMLVKSSSNEDAVVWDPFSGLATTAIACMETNRSCYTSEINPEYFEEAKNRIESSLFVNKFNVIYLS